MYFSSEPKVPGTNSKLLSDTEKMPCCSWSLPARLACPDAVYGAGMICSGCYATKGRYRGTAVKSAQMRRFKWTVELVRTKEGRQEWADTMIAAIQWATRKKEPIFRVHDSGDLFSVQYVQAWLMVCRALPEITFWFPTRAYDHGQKHLNAVKTALILTLAALPNVTMRPSALGIGDLAPEVAGMAAGTTVAEVGYNCPASNQGGKCLTCRTCFHAKTTPVTYHLIQERGRPRKAVRTLTVLAA